MPRLLVLRPWLGLAFLASAGICCLNPQPEPPTESSAVADPGDRGNGGPSKGNGGAGGATDGEAGGGFEPPNSDSDPDGGAGGNGDFGNGAGGMGDSDPSTGMPPDGVAGAAGAGGSAAPPDGPGQGGVGGAGAAGSGGQDEGCSPCGDVLDRGGSPCPGAIAKLAALVSCCHTSCGACKERIVRGDRVGNECTRCLADACTEALQACKAD